MTYNKWKLMDKIDVAVRNGEPNYGGFTGYIVEHGDDKALESAKDWATINNYGREKDIDPLVYTFDNEGFTATILDSAGGSYQGGRLSFWKCQIEKDGIKFNVGVNDAILADLIKNSDISNGVIKQKVMFARQGGQPGLIHENMQAYQEALADMKQKSDLKKAKKTKDWEIGGVYSTLTQTDICLGEVYDTLEEYETTAAYGNYGWTHKVTKLRKTNEPQKMTAWMHWYNFRHDEELPATFEELLQKELKSGNIYFQTGKPPARTKASQYEVKESDYVLLGKLFKKRAEYGYGNYNDPQETGRYVRKLK